MNYEKNFLLLNKKYFHPQHLSRSTKNFQKILLCCANCIQFWFISFSKFKLKSFKFYTTTTLKQTLLNFSCHVMNHKKLFFFSLLRLSNATNIYYISKLWLWCLYSKDLFKIFFCRMPRIAEKLFDFLVSKNL